MSEVCDVCGVSYSYIYWVPGRVWNLIKPFDEGDGGLLCLECAHNRALSKGITLRFPGTDQWWGKEAANIKADAVELYADALKMWLKELPGSPCASFIEGVFSSAEQAERFARRLRKQADELESKQ